MDLQHTKQVRFERPERHEDMPPAKQMVVGIYMVAATPKADRDVELSPVVSS